MAASATEADLDTRAILVARRTERLLHRAILLLFPGCRHSVTSMTGSVKKVS
jgi:hypothetical protein